MFGPIPTLRIPRCLVTIPAYPGLVEVSRKVTRSVPADFSVPLVIHVEASGIFLVLDPSKNGSQHVLLGNHCCTRLVPM